MKREGVEEEEEIVGDKKRKSTNLLTALLGLHYAGLEGIELWKQRFRGPMADKEKKNEMKSISTLSWARYLKEKAAPGLQPFVERRLSKNDGWVAETRRKFVEDEVRKMRKDYNVIGTKEGDEWERGFHEKMEREIRRREGLEEIRKKISHRENLLWNLIVRIFSIPDEKPTQEEIRSFYEKSDRYTLEKRRDLAIEYDKYSTEEKEQVEEERVEQMEKKEKKEEEGEEEEVEEGKQQQQQQQQKREEKSKEKSEEKQGETKEQDEPEKQEIKTEKDKSKAGLMNAMRVPLERLLDLLKGSNSFLARAFVAITSMFDTAMLSTESTKVTQQIGIPEPEAALLQLIPEFTDTHFEAYVNHTLIPTLYTARYKKDMATLDLLMDRAVYDKLAEEMADLSLANYIEVSEFGGSNIILHNIDFDKEKNRPILVCHGPVFVRREYYNLLGGQTPKLEDHPFLLPISEKLSVDLILVRNHDNTQWVIEFFDEREEDTDSMEENF